MNKCLPTDHPINSRLVRVYLLAEGGLGRGQIEISLTLALRDPHYPDLPPNPTLLEPN